MELNFEDEIALDTNGEIKSIRDRMSWAPQRLNPLPKDARCALPYYILGSVDTELVVSAQRHLRQCTLDPVHVRCIDTHAL